MDGFAGYKSAATDVVPDAVTVMDPFHVSPWLGGMATYAYDQIDQARSALAHAS